ncbi:hypothetical protein MKP08_10635 [Erythrobacter sp. LQ02-29]|uniref:hypothetical protein n=1 Tax=Erythrobacter sp. LQ02-29 TaxID=2920384 RepID=UPI001F4DFCA5|nr:hypothetical protein [Erythrobacter sp. LQ02-29]MCP9223206.1 hypothetical protein [Erythrobacter sp. LQ02-29]
MKALFALVAAAPLISAQAEPQDPMNLAETRATSTRSDERCRDTVMTVREDRGLLKLDRRASSSDKPLLYSAVDHRIDGCTVLVMKSPEGDIRPVPESDPRRAEFIPAR